MEQGGLNSRNVESLNWRMSVCFASNHHSIPFTFIFCRPILYVIAHILRLPWSLHDVVVAFFSWSVLPSREYQHHPVSCGHATKRTLAHSLAVVTPS